MNKFKKLKEAISNPPPERLAGIEYRSHFLQMIGVTFVCGMLLFKGFWYIIFAFIFSLGISYSQGMTAYQKYKFIASMTPKEEPKDFIKDVSPSRKRDKIIQHTLGEKAKWTSLFVSCLISLFWIRVIPRETILNKIGFTFAYLFSAIGLHIFIYFFLFYILAKTMYDKEMKQ